MGNMPFSPAKFRILTELKELMPKVNQKSGDKLQSGLYCILWQGKHAFLLLSLDTPAKSIPNAKIKKLTPFNNSSHFTDDMR